jgi:DNA polymerase-4
MKLGDVMERVILHCDLNCFYASVEMAENPELKKVPLAIGGDQEQRHGIILTKNYIAKEYGIKTGEALWAAKNKCPDLIIIQPSFKKYLKYSKLVKDIYYDYTDKIESFGIDEAWLDITHSLKLFDSPIAVAEEIKTRVRLELGLTLSVGISNNKIFAKLGSDLAGKDEYITLYNKDKLEQVYPLPVESLLYVGKATKKQLNIFGITTIGDLANKDINFLKHNFGKIGELLWVFSNGLDTSEVSTLDYQPLVKSIGNSTTSIRDLKTMEDVLIIFTVLADSVASRLREQELYAFCINIKIRTNKLKWSGVQTTLKNPTDLSKNILSVAIKLFKDNYNLDTPLRSLGIKASKLTHSKGYEQFSLFEEDSYDYQTKKIETSIDDIRSRFGYYSITNGRLLSDTKLSKFNPKMDHTIHPLSYKRK